MAITTLDKQSCFFIIYIDKFEKFQKRATKRAEGLEEYMLRILGLTTLETRFLNRDDSIEVFKILRGLRNVDLDRFFQVVGMVSV